MGLIANSFKNKPMREQKTVTLSVSQFKRVGSVQS